MQIFTNYNGKKRVGYFQSKREKYIKNDRLTSLKPIRVDILWLKSSKMV